MRKINNTVKRLEEMMLSNQADTLKSSILTAKNDSSSLLDQQEAENQPQSFQCLSISTQLEMKIL